MGEAIEHFHDRIPAKPGAMPFRADQSAGSMLGVFDQLFIAFWTACVLLAGLGPKTQLGEKLFFVFAHPFEFARDPRTMHQLAEFVLFSVAHLFILGTISSSGRRIHSMSLISFPVRAFSTVSSNLDPRSTPISRARFFAHSPTLRESL